MSDAVNSARLIRIMKKIPLFAGLQGEEYQQLLRICRVRRINETTRLFAKGDGGHSMFVILSGAVSIIDEEGRELHHLGPGEVMGEVAMVNQLRRSAGAEATEGSVLLELDHGGLESLLGRAPRAAYLVMRNIAEVLAERLVKANEAWVRYR